MQWFPIQFSSYILSNIFVWLFRLALTIVSAFALIRGLHMFANIIEFNIVVALCAVAMLAWTLIVQYSRYQDHIKSNANASEAKQEQARDFAVIPYLVIPVIFGAIAVVGALFCTDYLVCHCYIAGAEETAGIAIGLTVVLVCILDKYIVRNAGNAVYFDTIEDAISKSADNAMQDISAEDLKLLAVLKQLKK